MDDWLNRYKAYEGTMLSIDQIGQRIGLQTKLGSSMEVYKAQMEAFDNEFKLFSMKSAKQPQIHRNILNLLSKKYNH